MEFVKVNYSLNNVYYVESTAIKNIITNTFKSIKYAKLISSDVKITFDQKVFISIEIETTDNQPLSEVLVDIPTLLSANYKNGVGRRPENIQITFGKGQ